MSAAAVRSEQDQEALAELSKAVYPPSDVADWPGRHLDWVSPHWDIFVVDEDHGLVSYTGVVVREAEHDRNPICVGGIGAVKTHPNARSQGHARGQPGSRSRFLQSSATVD